MNGPLILVVDDDDNVRELLAVNLEEAGYRVGKAADGRAALHLVAQEKPRLVVLDVMMPEMDGWEVCKALKDDSGTSAIPVIMLTARDSERDRMIGKDIFAADEYLTKPFDMDDLLAAARRLIRG